MKYEVRIYLCESFAVKSAYLKYNVIPSGFFYFRVTDFLQ